ncbi:hypothetical protein [Schumannella sp. 10F1B-5-1]|uniref:hypothetical protein n=1 Tax=Schumannella sp. 10F1B-5-1 TaxID=2590780 RepID=UPI00113283D3|nr:hypothetical protein [Schumannella sp. 10F1B-5-1]TPW70293.1 hypothetical protein FJ658_14890 [Schumannella sp. 10F1B-5-1]
MIVIQTIAWIVAVLAVTAGAVLAGLGLRRHRPEAGLLAVAPIAIGLLLTLLGVRIPSPSPVLDALLALAIGAAGVVAGSPLTVLVLRRTAPAAIDTTQGENAGIRAASDRPRRESAVGAVGSAGDGADAEGTPREVMRGGGVIGYLERFAIIGAVALGRLEVLAAIIAIKGLGRFNDLDSSVARERFIIGTLVSMTWAGSCAALILLAGLAPKLG